MQIVNSSRSPSRPTCTQRGAKAVALSSMFLLTLLHLPNAVGQDAEAEATGAPEKELDGYTVRWGTTTTSFLPHRVIKKHGLRPSGRGVLSVVVIKDQEDPSTPSPVKAEVSAQATDRVGQTRDIEMRPVTSRGLTSYLGTFDVEDRDQLKFTIRVRPDAWAEARTVEFQRRFILD